MTDVAIKFTSPRFDINYLLGDLEGDDGLETAVIISLFSDRRVLEEELPPGDEDRRGWWGDLLSDFPGDQIGSKLWLISRGKASQQSRNAAEGYVKEALQWLLDDGIASALDVTVEIVNRDQLHVSAVIHRPRQKSVTSFRYALVWDAQAMKVRKI